MPTIPIYQRQQRYTAPRVDTSAPSPARLPKAYENSLQQISAFAQSALPLLDTPLNKAPAKQEANPPQRLAPQDVLKEESGEQDAAALEANADREVYLRAELMQSVRETAAQNGAVQTRDLDAFAESHFSPAQGDTPATRDYLLLRHTAQQEAQPARRQQRMQLAAQEENLLRQVGASASSAQALEAYFAQQLPAYEQRLRREGASKDAIQKIAASLRADTAAQCVRRSLAVGEAGQAQEFLAKYASQMTPSQQQECAQKILYSAADSQARQVWEQSALEPENNSLQKREQWAQKQLADPAHPTFSAAAQQRISALRAAEQTRVHDNQAKVYRAVLGAEKEDEAQRVLNSQQVLEPEELSILHRAVGEVFTRPQRCAKPEEFNQLYFSADEKSAARAYEKGHISARDYCLLQAVCHSRQAGQDDANTRLLCNGIARWGKQKELPEKDVQEITYAVLSSAAGTEEPSSAWKRVKALFDL